MKKEEINNKLKGMSVKELQTELVELERQKMDMEIKMTRQGSSMATRNYPTQEQTTPFGNVRNIVKNIARVKTYLNMKLNYGK